jgi:hypothetical protein
MATAPTAIFIQHVKHESASLAAANTARDGSGSIATVATVSADGAKVVKVKSQSSQATAATNSAMVVCWWRSPDAGTTWYKITEYGIAAVAADATTPAAAGEETFEDLLLDPSDVIGVTQTVYAGVQDKMHHSVIYGDYTV